MTPAPSFRAPDTYLTGQTHPDRQRIPTMFKGLTTAMLLVTAMLTAVPFGMMLLIE